MFDSGDQPEHWRCRAAATVHGHRHLRPTAGLHNACASGDRHPSHGGLCPALLASFFRNPRWASCSAAVVSLAHLFGLPHGLVCFPPCSSVATYFVNASHPAVSATGPEVINAGAASFGSVVQCNAIMLLVGGGGVVLLAVVVIH